MGLFFKKTKPANLPCGRQRISNKSCVVQTMLTVLTQMPALVSGNQREFCNDSAPGWQPGKGAHRMARRLPATNTYHAYTNGGVSRKSRAFYAGILPTGRCSLALPAPCLGRCSVG